MISADTRRRSEAERNTGIESKKERPPTPAEDMKKNVLDCSEWVRSMNQRILDNRTDVTPEMVDRAREAMRDAPSKFINSLKLSRMLDIDTRKCGVIIRVLGCLKWGNSKHNTRRTCFVIPDEIRMETA